MSGPSILAASRDRALDLSITNSYSADVLAALVVRQLRQRFSGVPIFHKGLIGGSRHEKEPRIR